jgi:CheY-like chemotaxis protein
MGLLVRKRILLIDDDADDQFIFTDALKEIAAEVECDTANNGLLGLTYLDRAKELPGLIFLDLNMPFMNGFQCLEKIRSQQEFNHIPIVIYTTSDGAMDGNRTKDLGADFFFTKTSDFSTLRSTLRRIIDTVFYAVKA